MTEQEPGLLQCCEGLDRISTDIVLNQFRYAVEIGANVEDARASAERLAAAMRKTMSKPVVAGPSDHCPHCGGSGFDPYSRERDPDTGMIHMDRCHVCRGKS